ncbi:hypothetical protein JOD43_000808 [Pullulanibacillus pueri]|nr:hypothetical protein [Pullulanibacillus pueri]
MTREWKSFLTKYFKMSLIEREKAEPLMNENGSALFNT